MPRLKRGNGFCSVKRGRSKRERGGGGRGTRGRRRYDTSRGSLMVGELLLDDNFECGADNVYDSDQSIAFRTALLSPTPSASGEDSRCCTPQTPLASTCRTASPVSALPVAPTSDCASLTESKLVDEVLQLLKGTLPNNWIAIADKNGFHVLMLSRSSIKSIQRNIFIYFSGSVEIIVHRRTLPKDLLQEILKKSGASVQLRECNRREFADWVTALAANVRSYEVCKGVEYEDYKRFWMSDDNGRPDYNPYAETRYEQTFRTHKCDMLLPVNKWRCSECRKALQRFKRRRSNEECPTEPVPNMHHTKEEMLEDQHN